MTNDATSIELDSLLRARPELGRFSRTAARHVEAARRAPARADGPVVMIVPGFLGSSLVKDGFFGDNVVWVDALEIVGGGFGLLRLSDSGVSPGDGAVTLRPQAALTSILAVMDVWSDTIDALRAEGATVALFAYDWRQQLANAVRSLRSELDRYLMQGRRVSVVGHSMGGLLSTLATFGPGGPGRKIERLVVGGAPYLGSFDAVDVFMGRHSMVKWLGRFDLTHSADELTAIAGTWPGLHDLLPSASLQLPGAADTRRPANYPRVRPRDAFLAASEQCSAAVLQALQAAEAQLGDRFLAIVGDGVDTAAGFQAGRTVVGSGAGDGTVPSLSASAGRTITRVHAIHGVEHMGIFGEAEVGRAVGAFVVRGVKPAAGVRRAAAAARATSTADDALVTRLSTVTREVATSSPQRLRDQTTRALVERAMTAAMADHPAAAEMAAEALEALGDVRAAGDGGSDVPVDGGWRPTRPLARPSRARADWNVFVYMAGDDWKEGGLSSVVDEDLREMGRGVAAARLRSTRVRVVAQCDRRGPSVTQRVVFDPDGDGEGRVVAAAPRNLNTGDPANLVDFLRWALQQGPADRTLVVLWGHGSGYDDTDIYASAAAGDDRFLAVLARRKLGFFQTTHRRRVGELLANRGYGFDDSSQDFLDTSDLRRALGEVFRARRHPASAGDGRAPLDALAFDACLMACAEVATELTDVADYLISSQDTEPGDGWPYGESLPALQPCADDEAVRAVVSSLARVYVESYEQRSATTASVLDCAGVVPVQAAVARWVAALNAALGSARTARATRGAWFTAASTARRFPLGRPEAYVDLHDLARLFQEALPEVPGVARTGAAAAQVTAAIGAAVLSSHSWSWPDVDDPRAAPVVPGVGGLSIYCPHAVGSRYGLGRDALRRYRALRFDQHTGWVNALRALGS